MSIDYPEPLLTSTFPGRFYYDPEIYAQELEHIFSDMWVCVSHVDALANPGKYQVISVGDESVILLRDQDETLRAFLNVCRHRGTRLCTESEGSLKGSLQCPYHAWTYGLDGKLIGAPHVFKNQQFDRVALGLLPVALAVWEGLIWINLSNHASSLEAQIKEAVQKGLSLDIPLARYRMQDLKIGKTITYDVQTNWKILLENGLECYHCDVAHPQFCRLVPNARTEEGVLNNFLLLADGVEAFTVTGRASRPPLPGLSPEDIRRFYGAALLPNVILDLYHDHVVLIIFLPKGPDATSVIVHWLFDAQAMDSPAFDPMDTVCLTDQIFQQDWHVCERTQLSMKSKAFINGGVYVPSEKAVRLFYDFLREKLQIEE